MKNDFGFAIRALKGGRRVARTGWNGRDMWLVLLDKQMCLAPTFFGGVVELAPCIAIRTAQGEMQPGWVASQADMLAEDWVVLF